jgi:DNA transposition AAA+ family ATPase
MSTYRDRLRTINRHAGRAADSTWEYIGTRGKPDDYYALPWQQQHRLDRELEEISTNPDRRPIAAEVLAVKMESTRRGELGSMEDQLIERPAIAELLWWLQYQSFQEGGLAAHVVAPLIEQEKNRLGFPELWEIKPASKGRFSEAQIRTLLAAAPDNLRGWLDLDLEGSIADIAYFNRDRLATPEAWLGQITAEIQHRLPAYLQELCQSPAVDFSGKHFTLIPDVIGRLIELMKAQADLERRSIAATETFRRVAEEIQYAVSQRGLVMIIGDSRLGKTVSAQAVVRMRPGRLRYMAIPSTNDLASLYRACAESLGVFAAPSVKAESLRHLVEYVFRVSGMAVVADEFHFTLPVQFTRRTKARRLDWIRTALHDKGVPIIAITTPQDMESWRRFMSYTQYTQNQFRGRLDQEVFLSPEISEEDIAAVARHVLKGCGDDAVELVIARALRCDMGLKVVDAIKRRAAWRAEKDGRTTFSDADLDGAWKELEPSFQHQPLSPERQAEAEAACKASAARLQPAEKPVATRLQSPRISRGKRPALPAPKPRGESIPDLVEA